MENEERKKFKRSFWRVVDRGVEIRLAMVGAWLIFLGLLVGSIFTYLTIWNNILVLPQLTSLDKLLIVQSRITKFLVLELILGGTLIIFLAATIQFRIMHRISGPLYRIEKLMQELAEGKLPKTPVVLREKDFYNNLAKTFNNLISAIKSGIKFN